MWRRRRLWIILLAVPLLLLAADTLYWQIAEKNLEDGFAAWAAERRASGWQISAGTPERRGWPTAATLDVPGFNIAGGEKDVVGGVAWSVDHLILRVGLVHPQILEVLAEGHQLLRADGNPPVGYTARPMRLTLPVGPEQLPPSFDLAVANLRADEATIGTLHSHVDLNPAAQSGQPVMRFTVRAADIVPPGPARVLGQRIAHVAMDGSLNGPVTTGGTLTEQATAWRDAGGSFAVNNLVLQWGPLDLSGSAKLALDQQMQPKGEGDARIRGYAEAFDALAANGTISRSAATAAKAVLSLLATMPPDGSTPIVDVPLTLRYRTLSMREVPLVRVPEVDWPK